MLVEFRVGNYRSFHEDQVLSLVAGNDDEHPGNLIAGDKSDLLKVVGLYGANASGKSNFVRAFDFVQSFVSTSATKMTIGSQIPVAPFRLSSKSCGEPSRFEATLLLQGVRYNYGFAVDSQRVHGESLVAFPKGRAQRWYERRLDATTGETHWVFRGALRRRERILREMTRDNGLVLSRGAELNIPELIPVFQYFNADLSVLIPSGLTAGKMLLDTMQRYSRDPEFRSRVNRLVRDADVGIDDLRVNPDAPVGSKLSTLAAGLLGQSVRAPAKEGLLPFLHSVHSVPGTDTPQVFDFFEAESRGTQRLFAFMEPWLNALDIGRTLIVDEFETSIHPVLSRKLIQLFEDSEANTSGAQLIFATHDTSLMDQSLFRRDQIWLVEKDASQASRLFSLYDFMDKPRKGEALEKRYLAGRYGGVPVFGPTFENLGTD